MLNSNNLKPLLKGFVLAVIIALSITTIVLLLDLAFDSGLPISQFINPSYQFIPPLIAEKDTIAIPVTLIFPNKTSTETNYPLKTITQIVFESTALSAQNPITVYSKLIFDVPENLNIVLQEEYYMFFPFSQDISKKRAMFENTQGMIILKKINESEFFGTGKIMYPFEGEQPFFEIMTFDELSKNVQYTTAYISGLDLKETIDDHEFITIEPSSVTTILRTNVIIVALTFAVIAFGLAQIRRNYL